MEFTPALFSTRVTSGKRTFFFDVKNTKDAKPYLRITESSLKDGQKQKSYMTVFNSEMPEFKKALEDVLSFVSQQIK